MGYTRQARRGRGLGRQKNAPGVNQGREVNIFTLPQPKRPKPRRPAAWWSDPVAEAKHHAKNHHNPRIRALFRGAVEDLQLLAKWDAQRGSRGQS